MAKSRPPIPPLFATKKEAILASLAVPDSSYTDLSPKGSVDEAIKSLIDRINSLEGIVTTSSCSGRISVFLEGSSKAASRDESIRTVEEDEVFSSQSKEQTAVPGGKGMGAAINAGFRESGVQSLKNLDDPNAFPMVAIRSSGLALESIVGYMSGEDGSDQCVHAVVGENYLRMMMKLANERFKTNTERIHRFEEDLFQRDKESPAIWEDKKTRQARKRAEGLKVQEAQLVGQVRGETGASQVSNHHADEDFVYTLCDSLPDLA
ncbi:hypothetical protein P7C71_g2912, partial [Lecanoromycetidae sp. Uapishka_2]